MEAPLNNTLGSEIPPTLQNLIIEYRSAEGRGERFADLAADLLRLNIDVIVTRGTPAVLAAKKATTTTPIVMPSRPRASRHSRGVGVRSS